MFKRIGLVMTFVAAFAVAGVSFSSSAQAWRSYYGPRPYGAYYYGPPRAYGAYYAPYRSYSYYGGAPVVVAPRVVRPYYNTYYAPGYYYGPGPGVSISVGY